MSIAKWFRLPLEALGPRREKVIYSLYGIIALVARPGARLPRVGINAQLLNLSGTYRSAGISNYSFHLLSRLPAEAADFELHVFTSELRARQISSARWHIASLPTRSPWLRILWEQAIQPVDLVRYGIHLAHSLAFVQPGLMAAQSIITVHDLSFLYFPGLFRPLNRLYLRWGTFWSSRRAKCVIAVSETTRQDLVRAFRLAPDRVRVIFNGVDERFFLPNSKPSPWPAPYLLYVGTLEPRKNVACLIKAFTRAKLESHMPHHLILAGARGWYYQEVERAIEDSAVRSDIHEIGFVAREDMPGLYHGAAVFIYPSRYEGFGLPPLEAMASGVPTIVSNAPSLLQVVGDAALIVRSDDEQALSDAILRVLSDQSLAQDLRNRGPAQASRFNWTKTAQETAAVYRQVLASSTI